MLYTADMDDKLKYTMRKTAGFIAYACGLWAMKYFSAEHSHSPYRYWLVLLPVLPMIYLILTFHRQLFEEKDEMWRKIITESLAFTATATAWTCCSFYLPPQPGRADISCGMGIFNDGCLLLNRILFFLAEV